MARSRGLTGESSPDILIGEGTVATSTRQLDHSNEKEGVPRESEWRALGLNLFFASHLRFHQFIDIRRHLLRLRGVNNEH